MLHWLLQVIVVIGVARCVGWVAQRLGQPRVVGEMAAGIMLGSSLLGQYAPLPTTQLFGLTGITVLSQVGLILFLVGLDLQPQQLRPRAVQSCL